MSYSGIVVGGTILLHAIYSSYEYASASKLATVEHLSGVPLSIKLQIFFGLAILLLSAVITAFSKMDPIKIAHLNFRDVVNGDDKYAYLETRPNFQDLIAKRKDYLDWRRAQNSTENSAEKQK